MSLVRNFIRVSNKQRKDEERKKREKQSGASRSAPKPASKPAPKPTPKPAAIGTKPAGIVGSAAIKHAALSASKSAMRGAQQSQSIKPISVQGGGQSFGSISKNARAAAPKRMGAILPDARTAPARVVQPSASGLPEDGQNGKGGGQRISDLLITGGFPSAPSGSQPGTQVKWYEQSGQGGLQSAQPGAQSGADRQNGTQPVRVAQPSASGLPKEYDRQEDKPVSRPDASRQNAGSNKLLSNILMTGGFANQTFPGAQPPVSLEQAEMNAKQRAERVNQALISGNWQEFAPTDGSSYKIVRPDDATLLGEAPTGPELLLGALSRAGAGGFGSEQWRERTEGVGLAFDNADGVASVQADAQAQGMAVPDARREAIDASMHAATGGALPYITGQQGDSADRRAAREQADERWQDIVDSYVSQTPFYTENKAQIDANRAQIDAALTQTSAQLDSTPAGTPEADALARDLRLLKKARYENEHADKSLMQRARAYETDAGRLQGEVSDEDRLRFGLSENIESDGTPLGDALANLARARFAGSADFLRYAKGKVRSVCNVITTVQAAAQGYDNVYDYLESADGAAEIMGEWAFDPTSQMDYAQIDFGGESWNEAQEISQMLFQNTMDMSLMHFGGGGIFASLAFQAPDSFAAASNAALEYGASTQDMLTSGTIVAAVETVMDRYGFDRLENAAGSVFSGLTPSLRKLLPEGLKQISKSPWARTLLNVLSAGVGEGFEEVGEYAIEGLTRRFVYDNTSEWWGEEGIFDPHEMLVEGGWGAAMGSLFTVTAGLGMDKGSASYELASDVLERAGTNRPFDAQLEELRATLPADAASHEHTAADVQAHAELWSARGQDVPQSYDAWLDAAQQADAAQAAYDAARGSMAQLLERAQAGELDPATPENAQIWQKAMQNMTDAEDALRTAAQRNVDARTAYMADEGAELDSIAAKHDALEEISGEIQAAIKDAADGRAQDARTLDVPEIRNAAEAVKNARLAGLSAQGDADAATIALRSADGPDAIIAAKQDVEAAQARVASAQQAAESAKAELQRAAMEQTDFDARMERGRAANEAVGRHDSRYDDMTDGELMAERERLKAIEQSSLERTDEVRGTARAARREAQEGIAARLAALDAETELRSEVYGGREYQTREMREEGGSAHTAYISLTEASIGASADTSSAEDVSADTTKPQAPLGKPPRSKPAIYRNGTLLFAGMDEAELTSEIAREGRISQDPDPAVSEPAKERLQALRSERDTRADASEKDARRARGDAARTDRLAEIDEMIKSIPEAPDGELSRHRNYLRRQINQLTIAQEGADKATVEMYSNEIQRMRESLKEIEKEEHGRADLRRADAERMAQELAGDPARAEVEGEARDVDILEKQRIKLNQQTGHEAIEKLKAEHEAAGRKWRVTDNISLEEAVRIFDDASGMTAQSEGEAPPGGTDALLSENRAALARWEQHSEALEAAIDDMERELDMLKRRKQRYGSDEDYSPEQIRDGMRENRLNDSISQAKALKRRAKRSIVYLQSHAGESTLDAARGGRLPEQMLERVMGMVDRLKIPKNGLISMNMNTATRVFDDLFGDEAPVMRALYTDQVARHVADMQRFTDGMRSRLSALKLDSKESELVQRFGEGLLTPDELAAEIDEQHAKRGTKLKDGSGEWTLETSLTAADDTAELNYEGYGDKADEVRRISNAAAEFADIYSELFDRINDARVRNGYEPMGKLENYFPHFLPASGGVLSRMARRMGFGGSKYNLPTSIDGLTEWNSPSKKYNVHSDKHRRGSQTEYNALEGFEEYIDAAGREIFLTDDIQRIRQLERAVRSGEEAGVLTTRQKPDKANGDFGSFAKWLHEYANLLAGKKSGIMDRGIEEMGGRVYYQAVDVLRKKRSAAAIAGSVVSAATNISPVVLVTAEHPAAAVKGLIGAVDALIHGDSGHGMPESDFLARRFGTDQLGVGMLARTARWISKPFQIFDIVSSNIVVRTNYYAGLDAGMDPESAMRCADDKAARLMADRSTGQMPNMYYSRTFMATLGQFQLEVANEIKRLSKDIPRTYGAPRATAIYGLTAIFCALANMGWKELTGRELFLDPLGSLKDGIDAGREKAEEEGPWKGTWEGIKTTAAGIGSGLPYIGGFFDGGRIGTNLLGDAWQAGGVIAEAVQAGNDGGAWDEAFWAMTNYVTYGGQFKKSYQAAGALMQNGVYDSQGRLMYPVDASDPWTRIQASVFGKSSTYYARKYWDEGRESLSAANTSTYEKLVQQGVSPVEAYEEVYAYQQATKLNGDMKDKIEEGDMEGAARLRMKRDEALRGVRYATLIPDDMAGSMGSATLDMLESAWREDMDNGFLPKAVRYNGQFTKGGVSYQFTDESMEKLQAVAQQELNRRMLTYKDEWADMSAEERAAALKTCTGGKSPSGEQVYKSSVWVYTKEYGFENGLEYMTTADYKAMHKDDKDKNYTNPNPGLTNPIADTVKALSGGFAQDGADVQTEDTAAGDTVLPEVQTYTGGDTRGSGGRSGGGGRGGRGGRRGGSRRRGSGGGMTVGMPEATVTIPWHRTRLYESFGEGYNPFPLSGQFEWGGQAYNLEGEELKQYTGLYDAYMDIYMRERQDEWDAADNERRKEIYRELDERAKEAAREQFAGLY